MNQDNKCIDPSSSEIVSKWRHCDLNNMTGVRQLLNKDFEAYWKRYNEEKKKEEQWTVVDESTHNCPDCMALVKVVVEREVSSGSLRTKIEFLKHRI